MSKRKKRISHSRIMGIMSGQDRDPIAHGLRLVTNLGVPPYRLVTGARNTLYSAHLLPSKRLGRPTISVGNLTTGGTGKTPMVIELAMRLLAMNHRPAVLMRGYEPKGQFESKQGSDEVAVLRSSLSSEVPVIANPSRVKGARDVLAEHPETTVFLLDDGFQHRRAHRDLNLVLVDASRPFGFGRVLPRGLMREHPYALRRADAIIVTRSDRVEPDELTALDRALEKITHRPPLAHACHHWAALNLSYKRLPVETLQQKTVFGVSGLGNPTDFEAKLREHAGRVVGCMAFDDHHPYSKHEVSGIFHTAQERGAEAIVTTEKDWVKWRRFAGGVRTKLAVYRPVVQMTFVDGDEALDGLLRKAVGEAPR